MNKSNINILSRPDADEIKQKNNNDNGNIFIKNQIKLLGDLQIAIGKQEKMKIALEIYKDINNKFCALLNTLNPIWVGYAASVYNKTTEFYDDLIEGVYDNIDKGLVDRFTEEIMNTRTFLTHKFINLKKTNPWLIDMNNERIKQAYNNIEYNIIEENQTPCRKIPRISA